MELQIITGISITIASIIIILISNWIPVSIAIHSNCKSSNYERFNIIGSLFIHPNKSFIDFAAVGAIQYQIVTINGILKWEARKDSFRENGLFTLHDNLTSIMQSNNLAIALILYHCYHTHFSSHQVPMVIAVN